MTNALDISWNVGLTLTVHQKVDFVCSTPTSIFYEAFPSTNEELNKAGLLDDGKSLSLLRLSHLV